MVNAFLGDLQGLVMLAGVAQRVGEIAHRGGEIAQFGRRLGVIGAGQKQLPTAGRRRVPPVASQWPTASRRTGMAWAEAPQSSSTRPSTRAVSRQLKRGIELRGLAEALDEGLELVHRPLRIALGEERPGVLPLVVRRLLP